MLFEKAHQQRGEHVPLVLLKYSNTWKRTAVQD